MLVKNKKGEVEAMRYDVAMAAVNAGTHEIVNVDPSNPDVDVAGEESPDLDAMTKEELLAEAQSRGVDVKASDTKAEILAALKA